ncbi:MAG: hexameric tyrosine-coordinated heme protein [Pseudomonadota bacterium]|uniref:hexameric tyrosine-coordinated heme protein n=1 Tax=Thalassovita sp. TaxID=1979401 RepID=UPI002AB1EF1F|nr:hexameric tyrosine-coordinated heme protein [Thalassovita sp.]MEC8042479.1 hexameric tyrosine-coordinated heme protein [Pseudomonadota bacterium]
MKRSRFAVKKSQPNAEVRERLRPIYEFNPTALIDISAIFAANFHTVAAARNFWRE